MKLRVTVSNYNGQTTFTTFEHENIYLICDEDRTYIFEHETECDCTMTCDDCDHYGCGCEPDDDGDYNCDCEVNVEECDDPDSHRYQTTPNNECCDGSYGDHHYGIDYASLVKLENLGLKKEIRLH